jgi:hypothetical protein
MEERFGLHKTRQVSDNTVYLSTGHQGLIVNAPQMRDHTSRIELGGMLFPASLREDGEGLSLNEEVLTQRRMPL